MGRGIIEAKHDTQIYRSFCAPPRSNRAYSILVIEEEKTQLQYSHNWMTVGDGEPVTLFNMTRIQFNWFLAATNVRVIFIE